MTPGTQNEEEHWTVLTSKSSHSESVVSITIYSNDIRILIRSHHSPNNIIGLQIGGEPRMVFVLGCRQIYMLTSCEVERGACNWWTYELSSTHPSLYQCLAEHQ